MSGDRQPQHRSKSLMHYTTPAAAQAIKETKVIKASTNTHVDASYGKGVYLTAKPPRLGPDNILRNNYDDRVARGSGGGAYGHKADAYVKVRLDDFPQAQQVTDPKTGRDVWRYPGNMDLSGKKFQVGRTADAQAKAAKK